MKYTILLLGISLLAQSCKKSNTSPADKTQQLTSADWKYNNGGIADAGGNIIVDFSTTGTIPACSLDNTIRFMANGSGTVSENTDVCPGAPATSTFTWNFSSSQTVLNLSSGAVAGLGGTFRIKELSDTRLSLLKDTTVSGFGSVTAVVNLKH